ncbi:MAG: hypothetical protein MK100_09160, partial [Phycisphaerales bacterium]|nr:hypothetical protein [Phycisphaerales bacterium]
MTHILHAAFTDGRLHVWAESIDRWRLMIAGAEPQSAKTDPEESLPWHPYGSLRKEFVPLLGAASMLGRDDECAIRLPRDLLGPFPSDRLAASLGGVDRSGEPWLARFRIATRSLAPSEALRFLLAIRGGDLVFDEEPGHDMCFWADVAHLAAERCESQRFVPSLRQDAKGRLRAVWSPWLQDEEAAERLTSLLAAMPPVTRGVDDAIGEAAWPRLESALETLTDGLVRSMLRRDSFIEAIEDRDPEDPHVQWLSGLLDGHSELAIEGEGTIRLMRATRSWIARLDDFAAGESLRLRLDLRPPASEGGTWG